ncbi:MAG TPA: hypothetical protein VGO11_15360 [Chthoniobacteraceae bacterium]|jgi:hypothetical protein|nr:hypothetical protein [Chthoniobacteraceae bacterium]
MPVDFPVTVEGVIDANGTLELLHAPKLPPGPVRVRLEAAPVSPRRQDERESLADEAMLDPWVELPLPASGFIVQGTLGALPLPDRPVLPEEVDET